MTQHPENQHPKNQQSSQDNESGSSLIGRRQVLTTGMATAAMLFAFPKAVKGQERPAQGAGVKAIATDAETTSCTIAPDCSSPGLTAPSDGNFTSPTTIYSTSTSGDTFRTLSGDLEVVESSIGTDTYARRFQIAGTSTPLMPGPTLCVYPGDRISLDVANKLPLGSADTYCPAGNDINRPHCFNNMNMHFHGLHVSPMTLSPLGNVVSGDNPVAKFPGAKSSDDVLFTLKPRHSHEYCVQLPEFHGPGTHWYHAHVHGSTALGMANGIVGALIVQDPPGEEILAGAPDVVMVIQEDLPPLSGTSAASYSNQQKADRAVYEQKGNQNKTTSKLFVNGSENPSLTIKQGEVQRWRIINATGSPRGFTGLKLVKLIDNPMTDDVIEKKQTLYRVAVDGVTLYGKSMSSAEVKITDTYNFSPGNRVDFLVDLEPGNYELHRVGFSSNASNNLAQKVLATITVTEEFYESFEPNLKSRFDILKQGNIPGTPPCYLADLPRNPALNSTPIVFQAAANGNTGGDVGRGDFTINGMKYQPREGSDNPTDTTMTVQLGNTEDWVLANISGAPHPFHIHVNPFQVVEIGTTAFTGTIDSSVSIEDLNITWNTNIGTAQRVWQDTMVVQPGEALKIRHRFWDYYGTFVLHCHVLVHEDQGMMWDVNITNTNDKGIDPCQTLTDCVTDYS